MNITKSFNFNVNVLEGGGRGLFDFHLGAKHSMYLGHVSLTFSNIFLEMKFFVSRTDLVRVTEL